MNKSFLIAILFFIVVCTVEAVKKEKLSNTNQVTVAAPPPKSGFKTSFLEGETSAFALFNFYEYTFYVEAYELYNAFALNSALSCSTTKKAYWYAKKLNAKSGANFCKLIGAQISSSYLSSYLCGYILGTVNWFNACSY